MRDDATIWPLLTDLAAEFDVALSKAGLPPRCFHGVLPGDLVPLDYCAPCGSGACGMSWVRLAGVIEDEANSIGIRTTRCITILNASFELGCVRCHQTMDARGNPMGMAYQEGVARQQLSEYAVMRDVLLCGESLHDYDIALGSYRPIGPDGACIGGVWSIAVTLDA